jgi:hypothetical protein
METLQGPKLKELNITPEKEMKIREILTLIIQRHDYLTENTEHINKNKKYLRQIKEYVGELKKLSIKSISGYISDARKSGYFNDLVEKIDDIEKYGPEVLGISNSGNSLKNQENAARRSFRAEQKIRALFVNLLDRKFVRGEDVRSRNLLEELDVPSVQWTRKNNDVNFFDHTLQRFNYIIRNSSSYDEFLEELLKLSKENNTKNISNFIGQNPDSYTWKANEVDPLNLLLTLTTMDTKTADKVQKQNEEDTANHKLYLDLQNSLQGKNADRRKKLDEINNKNGILKSLQGQAKLNVLKIINEKRVEFSALDSEIKQIVETLNNLNNSIKNISDNGTYTERGRNAELFFWNSIAGNFLEKNKDSLAIIKTPRFSHADTEGNDISIFVWKNKPENSLETFWALLELKKYILFTQSNTEEGLSSSNQNINLHNLDEEINNVLSQLSNEADNEKNSTYINRKRKSDREKEKTRAAEYEDAFDILNKTNNAQTFSLGELVNAISIIQKYFLIKVVDLKQSRSGFLSRIAERKSKVNLNILGLSDLDNRMTKDEVIMDLEKMLA